MFRHIAVAAVAIMATAAALLVGIRLPQPMVDVPAAQAALSDKQRTVLHMALSYGPRSDIRYVWGGSSPYGFDCSGYVRYIYLSVGVSLPHNSVAQWYSSHGWRVPRGQERVGDTLYFVGLGSRSNPGHVGIYIGSGKFIEYYKSGHPAHVMSLHWKSGYIGAMRWVHPVRVPKQLLGRVVFLAKRFDVRISAGWNKTVTFIPRNKKLVRWAQQYAKSVHSKAQYVTITFKR